MSTNSDFSDLFCAFVTHSVRYLVVGAYAVAFHGYPRYTKELDVWVDLDSENALRVFRALAEFGAPLEGITAPDFMKKGLVYQIGIEPNRIDILMGLGGLDFEACYSRASVSSYAGVPIRILCLEDLVEAKRRSGRPQDILDIDRLTRRGKSVSPGEDG
jgi:hypothetical protein